MGESNYINKEHLYISNMNITIPTVLWGKSSKKLLIEVHGNLSNKEDTVISIMAEKGITKGYQAPCRKARTQRNDQYL